MKPYKARYVNTNPDYPGETRRTFYSQENAERWLKSHGLGKFNEFYIDGKKVELRR